MANVIEIRQQPDDPIGGASGEKRVFHVRFLGKTNNDGWPHTIANEVVATHIGQALGLNLPTVLTHQNESGTAYALIQWQDFVPKAAVEIEEFVRDNPREVHGAILFDLFIANNDRAFGPDRRNLAWDGDDRLLLYDQGNACFYRHRNAAGIAAGVPRLDAVENDLTALNDMADKGNVYFQLLTDWQWIEWWYERIRALPDFVFESAVASVPRSLPCPTAAERDRLVRFFVARKT